MRTLCLNLHQTLEPSCAEIFGAISPRVQFRYPQYIFIDIESISHLHGGDFKTLKKTVDLARQIAPQATASIADQPYTAQVLVQYRPFEISKTGQDSKTLSQLSIGIAAELEGLQRWEKPGQIQKIIQFFQSIGVHSIEKILDFSLSSFRERWGTQGVLLYERLHAKDQQVISPVRTVDPLQGYAYFDEVVSTIPHLREKLDSQLAYLFLRLAGLSRFAQSLEVIFHCEYSDKKIQFRIEPVSPSRDYQLYHDLLLKKLESLDLQNPMREFELVIHDVPEKSEQLDFFQNKDHSKDRWQRLISFAQQADCKMGFLEMSPHLLPEKSFRLVTDWPKEWIEGDTVEFSDKAIKIKSVYTKKIHESPRPSLLLQNPLLLTKTGLQKLRFLSRFPIERIETHWWDLFKNKEQSDLAERDYFFALSEEGQLLWVYQQKNTEIYYLHGYFD